MRVDAYSKAVLTVIALCLLWQCITGSPIGPRLAPRLEAQNGVVFIGGIRYDDRTLRFGQNVNPNERLTGIPVITK